MAKKEPTNRAALVQQMMDVARITRGKETAIVGADLSERIYLGLPTLPLCLQYLLGVNVFPLNIIMQLRGPYASAKSSLGLLIASWFLQQEGEVIWVDVENKFPADIAHGLLGEQVEKLRLHRLGELAIETSKKRKEVRGTANVAQRIILDYLHTQRAMNAQIREHNAKQPEDPWREVCMLVVLDSLGAALSDDDIDRLEGYDPDKPAPYAAIWRKPLARIVSLLVDSNATFLIINHERANIAYAGVSAPGGSQRDYLESLDLRISPYYGASKPDEYDEVGQQELTIQVMKNSAGPKNRKLKRLIFSWDTGTGEFRFHTDFASAHLLSDVLETTGEPIGWLEDLKLTSGENFTSESLGATRTPADQIMVRLQEDEVLMEDIRKRLGIRKRPEFRQVQKPTEEAE